MKKKISYLIGFCLIAGSIAFILLTSFRSSLQYYLTVSELKAAEKNYVERTLKVAGRAASIVRENQGTKSLYRFQVNEGGKSIPVSYRGIVPDTFKEGSEVVVTGRLMPDGSLEATEILAKCASKYEAKLDRTDSH